MSRATSLVAVGQQVSISAGVAIGALAVDLTLRARGRTAMEITAADFQPAYIAIALIAASSVFIFARMPEDAGAELAPAYARTRHSRGRPDRRGGSEIIDGAGPELRAGPKKATPMNESDDNDKEAPARRKGTGEASPSRLIDARIKELGDWRGETLARVRKLIKEACPDVVEEWKWRGVPVWEHDGIICTGETYKAVVKLTFAKGAALDDPSRPLQLELSTAT